MKLKKKLNLLILILADTKESVLEALQMAVYV